MCKTALRGTKEGGRQALKIIKMTTGHVKALAELDKACFAVPWSENSFRNEAENALAKYFVAEENGEIVGYGGVWIVGEEGQITNIAVLPKYRRCGIASMLLEKIIEECTGLCRIVLEVRESNKGAISLYEKFGFKNVGTRKNFYHSPTENAIIMIRGDA